MPDSKHLGSLFDKDFADRTALDEFIDDFSQRPASWRKEFLDRFEASQLDEGGKEFLSNLAQLDFTIRRIKKEDI
jgi:hypothetical protein